MLLEPHHDGSELYVSNSAPKLGEKVTFKVRIPNAYKFNDAVMRYYHDGEPRTAHLKKVKQNKVESWWGVTIPIINHETRYRFLFAGNGKYDWLSAAGLTNHDVHSNTDFQLIARPEYPKWLKSSVFYQIFPDRFAKTYEKKLPKWAVARDWNLPPRDKTKYKEIAATAKQFCFGVNGKNPCPVRSECLWDAISRDEPHGIWGGYSHRERNAIVRKWGKSHKKSMTLQDYIFEIDTEQ